MKTKKLFKHLLTLTTLVGISLTGQSQATFVNDNCILTLPAGTKLVLSGGTGLKNQNNATIVNKGDIYVSGDWANTGVADIDEGTVYFNGTTQQVSGNTDFNYVNFESSTTTTMVSGTQAVKSILRCDGTLNSNGHLTLLSVTQSPTVVKTALINGAGTGEVNGTVTQQRMIPGAKVKGYKHFSSAFSNATFGQIGAFTPIILGAPGANPYPTIFKYHEPNASTWFANGWIAAAPQGQTGNTIEPGFGYTIQFGANPSGGLDKLTSLSGTVNNGDVSIDIYRSSTGNASGNGWNLIGNPYPSPLDLHLLPFVTADITKSVSIWISTSMYNGYYGYYNAALPPFFAEINGGKRILPALHGAFVQKINMGTETMTFNNSMRTLDLTPNQFKNEGIIPDFPAIKLASSIIADNVIADETAILFIDDATINLDSEYDASKILNTDPMIPNLFSVSNNEHYAINALPNNLNNATVIPLGFKVQTTGEYVINALDILNIPANTNVYLEDLAKGNVQDLTSNPTYTFTANKDEQAIGRFFLRFAPSANNMEEEVEAEIYQAWSSGNTLFVSYNNPSGLTGKVRIMNVLGQQIIQEQNITNGIHQFSIMQPAGYYLVNFTNETTTKTTKIFINN